MTAPGTTPPREPIRRWDLHYPPCAGHNAKRSMEHDDYGDWVRYEDHVARVKALEAALRGARVWLVDLLPPGETYISPEAIQIIDAALGATGEGEGK